MTARIVAASSAFPEHVLDTGTVREQLREVFSDRVPNIEVYCRMVDHAGIDTRHIVLPVGETTEPKDLGAKNGIYTREACRLAERAASQCLAKAGVAAGDIDFLVTLSCTGFMIPAVDAFLINRLGFREDVERMPVTEMGCAAGAWALSRARDRALACPGGLTLIVSVELPSLTFQRDDLEPANLVSSVLFGDGAAAVLVAGDGRPGIRIRATRSVLFPGTTGLMGFDLDEEGFHIVLDRKIPALIAKEAQPRLARFLADHGLTPGDIGFWVIHPGGQKILDSIARAFSLGPVELEPTMAVWRKRGNLSSATVLAVLEQVLGDPPGAGSVGLAVAFGPGFCMQMALLESASSRMEANA